MAFSRPHVGRAGENPISDRDNITFAREAPLPAPVSSMCRPLLPSPMSAGATCAGAEHGTLPFQRALTRCTLAPLSGMKVKAFIDFMIEEPGRFIVLGVRRHAGRADIITACAALDLAGPVKPVPLTRDSMTVRTRIAPPPR